MQLQNHLRRSHQTRMEMTAVDKAELAKHNEAEHILIDAIKLEDQELVRSLKEQVLGSPIFYLTMCLEKPTSPAMLELLLSICDPVYGTSQMSSAALRLADPAYLKLLLQHNFASRQPKMFIEAAKTRSPEMFRFLTTIQSLEFTTKWTFEPHEQPNVYEFLDNLIPKKPDVTIEADTLECLGIIKSALKPDFLISCFITVAQRCSSQLIAMFCMENGVNVDDHRSGKSPNLTALWFASGSGTREAAELMKLLLTRGANPDRRFGITPLRDRTGPRNISKWFGMEWDDFVKDCQNEGAIMRTL